jgi:serine protease Do
VAVESMESVSSAISSAGARMVERAQKGVVQVRQGERGAGAGVIWDEAGIVLTNHHVVAGGRRGGKVRVILQDGRTFDAEVVKRGRGLDLALLRIPDLRCLAVPPVGDSDALRVGELVFAIGHPWGRLGSVTAGIVSGLGTGRGPGRGARYIQSDVSLAPGNSGGPLLNARGEVVGINAMIYGSLALSIPSNAASAWAAGMEGRPSRLGVGIRPVALPPTLDREAGLMIVAVEAGDPADRSGLLVGDVLLGAGGEPIEDVESLLGALARAGGAGDKVRLRVLRGGEISFLDVDLRVSGPGRAA